MTGQTLRVDQADSGYGHTPVLRGISLDVPPGSCIGVLGANGAGKTTLLRLITGTLKLWSGSITFGETDLARYSPWRRVRAGIAHVPEGRRVFGPMTVEENLKVGGLVSRQSAGQVDRVYDMFPTLAQRRNQRADTLSGGEQQMLAIGRALMTGPSLLLVDEMSAGLAPSTAEALVQRLEDIRAQGISLLLVEQNPYLIADIVEQVMLLEGGRVVGHGRLDDFGGPRAIGRAYLGVRA